MAGCMPALFQPLFVVFTSIKPPICNIDFLQSTPFTITHTKTLRTNSMAQSLVKDSKIRFTSHFFIQLCSLF